MLTCDNEKSSNCLELPNVQFIIFHFLICPFLGFEQLIDGPHGRDQEESVGNLDHQHVHLHVQENGLSEVALPFSKESIAQEALEYSHIGQKSFNLFSVNNFERML